METLQTLLQRLQLSHHLESFEGEAIMTVDELVNNSYSEQDFADLGLKMGERKRLVAELALLRKQRSGPSEEASVPTASASAPVNSITATTLPPIELPRPVLPSSTINIRSARDSMALMTSIAPPPPLPNAITSQQPVPAPLPSSLVPVTVAPTMSAFLTGPPETLSTPPAFQPVLQPAFPTHPVTLNPIAMTPTKLPVPGASGVLSASQLEAELGILSQEQATSSDIESELQSQLEFASFDTVTDWQTSFHTFPSNPPSFPVPLPPTSTSSASSATNNDSSNSSWVSDFSNLQNDSNDDPWGSTLVNIRPSQNGAMDATLVNVQPSSNNAPWSTRSPRPPSQTEIAANPAFVAPSSSSLPGSSSSLPPPSSPTSPSQVSFSPSSSASSSQAAAQASSSPQIPTLAPPSGNTTTSAFRNLFFKNRNRASVASSSSPVPATTSPSSSNAPEAQGTGDRWLQRIERESIMSELLTTPDDSTTTANNSEQNIDSFLVHMREMEASVEMQSNDDATTERSTAASSFTLKESNEVAQLLEFAGGGVPELFDVKTAAQAVESALQYNNATSNVIEVVTAAKLACEAAAAAKIQRHNCARFAERIVDFIQVIASLPREKLVSLSNAAINTASLIFKDVMLLMQAFSQPGFLKRIAYAQTDITRLQNYDNLLARLAREMNLPLTVPPYRVFGDDVERFDVLSLVADHHSELASKLNISLPELKREIAQATWELKLFKESATAETTFGPHLAISHTGWRTLWLRLFPKQDAVPFEIFFSSISKNLPTGSLPTSPAAVSLLRERLCINGVHVACSTLARLTAFLPDGAPETLLRMLLSDGTLPTLPALPSAFIGREDQVQIFSQALISGAAKVLWLHGRAGVGKSAIAIAVAQQAIESNTFATVYYVDVRNVKHSAVSAAILAQLDPSRVHISADSLSAWAASQVESSLVIVDGLDDQASEQQTALSWMPLLIATPPSMVSIIVTSRFSWPNLQIDRYVPPPASLSLVRVEPLDAVLSERLLRCSLPAELTTEELISSAKANCTPEDIAKSATNAIRRSFAAPSGSNLVVYRDLLRACAQLSACSSGGDLDTDAVLAIIGNHTIETRPPTILTRFLLRQLIEAGMLIEGSNARRTWRVEPNVFDIVRAYKPLEDEQKKALLRYRRFFLIRLKLASKLRMSRCPIAAGAIVNASWSHIGYALSKVEGDGNLSVFTEAVVDSDALLAVRMSQKEMYDLASRVFNGMESVTAVDSSLKASLQAWAEIRRRRPDKALLMLSQGPNPTAQHKAIMAEALLHQALSALKAVRQEQATLSSRDPIFGVLNRAKDLRSSIDESHPINGAIHRTLAQANSLCQNVKETVAARKAAAEAFMQSLGFLHPETSHSLLVTGLHFSATNQLDSALAYLEMALASFRWSQTELFADTITACFEVGLVYEKRKVYNWAIMFVHRALVLSNLKKNNPSQVNLIKQAMQRLTPLSTAGGVHYTAFVLEELIVPVETDANDWHGANIRSSKRKYGFKLNGVKRGSLAALLALEDDDLIVGYNGETVGLMSVAELAEKLQKPLHSVSIRRMRNVSATDRIVYVQRPVNGFGVSVVSRPGLLLGAGLLSRFEIDNLLERSYLQHVGLRSRDQLLAINDQPIDRWTLSMVNEVLLNGEVRSLTVRRVGGFGNATLLGSAVEPVMAHYAEAPPSYDRAMASSESVATPAPEVESSSSSNEKRLSLINTTPPPSALDLSRVGSSSSSSPVVNSPGGSGGGGGGGGSTPKSRFGSISLRSLSRRMSSAERVLEDTTENERVIPITRQNAPFKIKFSKNKKRSGFKITEVEGDGYGAQLGLSVGDIIIAVNGEPVGLWTEQNLLEAISSMGIRSLTVVPLE